VLILQPLHIRQIFPQPVRLQPLHPLIYSRNCSSHSCFKQKSVAHFLDGLTRSHISQEPIAYSLLSRPVPLPPWTCTLLIFHVVTPTIANVPSFTAYTNATPSSTPPTTIILLSTPTTSTNRPYSPYTNTVPSPTSNNPSQSTNIPSLITYPRDPISPTPTINNNPVCTHYIDMFSPTTTPITYFYPNQFSPHPLPAPIICPLPRHQYSLSHSLHQWYYLFLLNLYLSAHSLY
jgi:hypothetical protein